MHRLPTLQLCKTVSVQTLTSLGLEEQMFVSNTKILLGFLTYAALAARAAH